MPFTAPNVFTSGTNIVADELQENQDELRRYLNTEIDIADIENHVIDVQDIIRGEPYIVTRDHQFTSGDMYTHFYDTSTRNRTYITGTGRQVLDYETFGNWTNTTTGQPGELATSTATYYQDLANIGKRIYLEASAYVIVHMWIQFRVPGPSIEKNTIYPDHMVQFFGNIYNTTEQPVERHGTFAMSFTEDGSSTLAGDGTAGWPNVRGYPLSYGFFKSGPGWLNLQLRYSCQQDIAYASAKNVTIEVLYF